MTSKNHVVPLRVQVQIPPTTSCVESLSKALPGHLVSLYLGEDGGWLAL